MQELSSRDFLPRFGAFELIAALDTYHAAAVRLVESWLDMDAYAQFAREIEPIREHGAAVPGLTVLALQLVIAHAELVSALWQHSSVGVSPQRMKEVRLRHALAVQSLRAEATRLAGSQ